MTYENSQARERTQMIYGKQKAVFLWEPETFQCGWATYNGDHMSVWCKCLNPEDALVRHLVRYYADTCGDL